MWKTILVITPLVGAGLVAASRIMDARHHPFDVLFGSTLGLVVSYASYRQYFPALSDVKYKGKAYPRRTWGTKLGDIDRVEEDRIQLFNARTQSSLEDMANDQKPFTSGFSSNPSHTIRSTKYAPPTRDESPSSSEDLELGNYPPQTYNHPSQRPPQHRDIYVSTTQPMTRTPDSETDLTETGRRLSFESNAETRFNAGVAPQPSIGSSLRAEVSSNPPRGTSATQHREEMSPTNPFSMDAFREREEKRSRMSG